MVDDPHGGYHPPDSTSSELKRQATTWLIVSALSFMLCAGVNCFGLIGAILCFLAIQAADQGHPDDAESKLKWGKIISVCGVVLSILGAGLSLLYYLVARATL